MIRWLDHGAKIDLRSWFRTGFRAAARNNPDRVLAASYRDDFRL